MKNYFQFACELEPIDRFPGCMSKDDLLENLPPVDGKACQLCALTQIESGRCYLFTPDCTPILVYAIQGRKLYCL